MKIKKTVVNLICRLEFKGSIFDATNPRHYLPSETEIFKGKDQRWLPGTVTEYRDLNTEPNFVYRIGVVALLFVDHDRFYSLTIIDELKKKSVKRKYYAFYTNKNHAIDEKDYGVEISKRDGLWWAIVKYFEPKFGSNLFKLKSVNATSTPSVE